MEIRRFHFTRHAFRELEEIYNFSVQRWGKNVADQYQKDLYKAFQAIAERPELGERGDPRPKPKRRLRYDRGNSRYRLSLVHLVRSMSDMTAVGPSMHYFSRREGLPKGLPC